jgi:hypothetical protein
VHRFDAVETDAKAQREEEERKRKAEDAAAEPQATHDDRVRIGACGWMFGTLCASVVDTWACSRALVWGV